MIKHLKNRCLRALRLILFIYISTSCVNNIKEEEVPLIPGTIPIQISTQITCTQTRVANNQFTADDSIGLYVLPESKTLNEKRYVDNMRFVSKDGLFQPDQTIYYPTGSGKYDFISYYPYRANAILPNESTIHVSVRESQNVDSIYSISDFMVAKTTGVIPSNLSVELKHAHKLCQVGLVVQLTEEEDINELKQSTSIVINNTLTQATYNFIDDTFSSGNTPKDITPNGEWVVDEAACKLVGKKALLIPQEVGNGKLTLKIQGKIFAVPLPNDMKIVNGSNCELTLHYSSKMGIKGISPSIGEWQEGSKSDVVIDTDQNTEALLVSDLNFGQSSVYHIVDANNTILAEVCKEYLLSNTINAQAIVLYPAGSKEGTVLQLLNTAGAVHGGTVAWDIDTNSLIYTAGTSAYIATLYADTEGNIVFTQPENTQLILPQASVIKDIRSTESITYPIVKIGTQYWMRENLQAIKYNDATPISLITDLTKTGAGYYTKDGNQFYNKSAVAKGTLAPSNWKIPCRADWDQLEKYIGNNTARLKAGTLWQSSAGVNTANNLSGFGAQPIGLFYKATSGNASIYSFKNKYSSFWHMDNASTPLVLGAVGLSYETNSFTTITDSDYGGYAIRCLRE